MHMMENQLMHYNRSPTFLKPPQLAKGIAIFFLEVIGGVKPTVSMQFMENITISELFLKSFMFAIQIVFW